MAQLETMVSDKLWRLLGVIVSRRKRLWLSWNDDETERQEKIRAGSIEWLDKGIIEILF